MDAMLAAAPHAFDFSSGDLCLDFVNTWEDRSRPGTDHLGTYGDLLAFAAQGEVLGQGELAELARVSETEAARAEAALAQARTLREAIYALLSPGSLDGEEEEAALKVINDVLSEALGHLRLQRESSCCQWRWGNLCLSLEGPLWPIVRSTAELMTAKEKVRRVSECHGESCTWLFLDTSRNRSRRWCSMETCGNRAKARRSYRRRCRGEAPEV